MKEKSHSRHPANAPSPAWREVGGAVSGTRRWCPSGAGETLPDAPADASAALELRTFGDLHGRIFDPAAACDRFHFWLPEWKVGGPGRFCLGAGDDHVGDPRWDAWMDDGERPDPAYALYASAGVDALVPGNHDLDWGWARWAEKLAGQPALSAVWSNLETPPGAPRNFARRWILERGAVRLGLLGLLTEVPAGAALSVTDPLEALREGLAALAGRVDRVVILSHLGRGGTAAIDDARLRAFVGPDVLIVGAHTHHLEPSAGDGERAQSYLATGEDGRFLGRARALPGAPWWVATEPWPAAVERHGSESEQVWMEAFSGPLGPVRATRSWPAGVPPDHARLIAWIAATLAGLPPSALTRHFAVQASIGLAGRATLGGAIPGPGPRIEAECWRGLFPFQDQLVEAILPLERAFKLLEAPPNPDWAAVMERHPAAAGGCAGGSGAVRVVTHEYAAAGQGLFAAVWREIGIDAQSLSWSPTRYRLRSFLWNELPPAVPD